MPKHYTKAEIKHLPKSELEIQVTIEYSIIEPIREKTLKQMAKDLPLPGFRKGHVPPHIALEKLGEMAILLESSERAIELAYPEIIEIEKLKVFGKPDVSIKKIAPKNDLEFSIKSAVVPEVSLPDYKKIAKDEMSVPEEKLEVSNPEIDEVLMELRKQKAHMKFHQKNIPHDPQNISEKDLPELNDEFAKSIGDFANLEKLKEKIKENLISDKERKEKEKKRIAIFEKILLETNTDLPNILIENEIDRMVLQFKDEISKAGISYDEYLKRINKKEEDVRNEWRADAEKKAKLQLIISSIGDKENIKSDSEEARKETEKILILHPDADPIRVRIYVEMMLTNEKVFQFLENQK